MLTPQAEGVVLLTAMLGKQAPGSPTPLSVGEWADFAQMLRSCQTGPEQLLDGDIDSLMSDWTHSSITADRVRGLLSRGTALALCREKWERAGLWLLVRSDPDYPRELKRRLEWKSPPLLFGCGNRNLLAKGGLAVVGSRHASSDDLAAAARLGREAATNACPIVSGGAKGIDETVMLASLEAEGTAVGVLAAGLQRAATSRQYRQALQRGDLALVSPFSPDARFHVGNAMGRNRYIYCLASSAVVVASKPDTGGTWSGAVENLKHGWVPMWAHRSSAADSGNANLVKQGAHWLPPDDLAVVFRGGAPRSSETSTSKSATKSHSEQAIVAPADLAEFDHYGLFLHHMELWAAQAPISQDDLERREDVRKDQLRVWLKRGIKEGAIDECRDGHFQFVDQRNKDAAQSELPL